MPYCGSRGWSATAPRVSAARRKNISHRHFPSFARGHVEGRNVVFDRRSRFGLDSQGRDAQMADVVRLKPDVIIVDGTGDAVRAIKLTSSIPVVMAASVEPVGAGLANSLARPGRNVTGLVMDVGVAAEEKRLELFLELLPNARRL